MPSARASSFPLMALLLAALAACGAAQPQPPKTRLGVLTTLPIYWNETAGIEEMLSDKSAPPWTRRVIEERFIAVPLDTLAGEGGVTSVDALLLAQPRALSAAENVALDEWVRGGGRVLLFADPLLTVHSRFPIGDRRRPQDVVLLSPILTRWGLELEFVEDQPEGERTIAWGDVALPVDLPGRLRARGDGCRIAVEGLVARCAIGAGEAVVIADAALLDEPHHGDLAVREEALRHLLGDLARESAR
jgi:hypothetical protein